MATHSSRCRVASASARSTSSPTGHSTATHSPSSPTRTKCPTPRCRPWPARYALRDDVRDAPYPEARRPAPTTASASSPRPSSCRSRPPVVGRLGPRARRRFAPTARASAFIRKCLSGCCHSTCLAGNGTVPGHTDITGITSHGQAGTDLPVLPTSSRVAETLEVRATELRCRVRGEGRAAPCTGRDQWASLLVVPFSRVDLWRPRREHPRVARFAETYGRTRPRWSRPRDGAIVDATARRVLSDPRTGTVEDAATARRGSNLRVPGYSPAAARPCIGS